MLRGDNEAMRKRTIFFSFFFFLIDIPIEEYSNDENLSILFLFISLIFIYLFTFYFNFRRSFFSELDKKNLKYVSEHVFVQMAILAWMVYF